jgi:hypothetical protein
MALPALEVTQIGEHYCNRTATGLVHAGTRRT